MSGQRVELDEITPTSPATQLMRLTKDLVSRFTKNQQKTQYVSIQIRPTH
jgi:hypothetical protein